MQANSHFLKLFSTAMFDFSLMYEHNIIYNYVRYFVDSFEEIIVFDQFLKLWFTVSCVFWTRFRIAIEREFDSYLTNTHA